MEMSVTEILAPWTALNDALGLTGPIRDEVHYQTLLKFVEECFDTFGADDPHPIFGLVSIVADRIREYESLHHPWPDTSSPETVMAWLIEEHQLEQKDLPEIGLQPVISAILAGKRKLNLRQIRALSARFHIPIQALIR
jgi:HTH-type transcriptional regulator / antitoxin HigA